MMDAAELREYSEANVMTTPDYCPSEERACRPTAADATNALPSNSDAAAGLDTARSSLSGREARAWLLGSHLSTCPATPRNSQSERTEARRLHRPARHERRRAWKNHSLRTAAAQKHDRLLDQGGGLGELGFRSEHARGIRVMLTQACGKGSGGSEVAFSIGEQVITDIVPDTGAFTNWTNRVIGTFTLSSRANTPSR